MVLPFIAAAATGFLEEGVKQKDLYDKRQFELEKQRQASKLRKQEQRELYDYKASLEKAKLDAEKAGFNKELFGVSYNTQGMTNFNDKAIAAVNAVSSDPTSAISYTYFLVAFSISSAFILSTSPCTSSMSVMTLMGVSLAS